MTSEVFFQRHTKITRSLKTFIRDYQLKLSMEVFEGFLDSLSAELQAVSTIFQNVPAGVGRARKLHDMVEHEVSQGAAMEVSCRKGCSACCHMEVEITSYEAEILADILRKGHSIDLQRLQKQSFRDLQDASWKEGIANVESRCVFLGEDGACSIYESRPVMCRRHSVTSPAKNCETKDAPITLRYFPRVDLLISAANEDPNMTIGPLAKMLSLALL